MPVNFYAPPLAPHGCFMMDTIKFYVCARRYSREQMSGDYHDVFLIDPFGLPYHLVLGGTRTAL